MRYAGAKLFTYGGSIPPTSSTQISVQTNTMEKTAKKGAKLQGSKAQKVETLKGEVLINKVTAKVVNKPLKMETKNDITYLSANVTGKQMLKMKFDANKENKEELQSLSFCIKQFNKHGAKLISGLKSVSMKDVTPKNILPFLTDKEKEKQAQNGGKFSFYLVENLVIRMAKSKVSK